MPCLEISMPKVDAETRARVASALTEAFASSTPFGGNIFGVRFCEYEPGTTAVGGRIQGSDTDAPYLHFLLYCPRIGRGSKQKLAAALSQAFASAVDRANWLPVVHISEHPYDNVIVNGKLLSDAFEECAKRSFYYELPKD